MNCEFSGKPEDLPQNWAADRYYTIVERACRTQHNAMELTMGFEKLVSIISLIVTIVPLILLGFARSRLVNAFAEIFSKLPDFFSKLPDLIAKYVFGHESPPREDVSRVCVEESPIFDPAENGLKVRFQDVKKELRRQRSLATVYRIADTLLTIGQFIVGGLLASSFLQEKLPREMVGFLGLIVLGSSLLRQHFRPDAELAGCRQRAVQLKLLIRTAEDQLFSRDEGDENAPTLSRIRSMLSDGLTKIEESQLPDLSMVSRTESQPSKGGKIATREVASINS
jgi:hypothetical protein